MILTVSNLFQDLYCCMRSIGFRKETAGNAVYQEETSEILVSKQIETGFKKATGTENLTRKWRIPLSGEGCLGGNVK